jgi:hydrogenase maturation protein HypF
VPVALPAGSRCGNAARVTAQRSVEVEVRGTVQGVGFRPYVYRLAIAHGLHGSVCNAGGSVLIRVGGPPPAVSAFLDRLPADAPSAARIAAVASRELPPNSVAGAGFRVGGSAAAGPAAERAVSPDLATCAACLAELWNPADRRYRYPFLNCTDCGPRASIIDDLPYDRERTAMTAFTLCPACTAEYRDPTDRRFHAEPVACPRCGPQLRWLPGGAADPLAAAADTLRSGGLVAVKGIGGYQLSCDATDDAAVARLRTAKDRLRKPLAVMVPDLAAARRLVRLSAAETDLLTSPAAPIVLAARNPDAVLAAGVCPGLPEIGVVLPYSPLHHLLLAAVARPLVLTSGNRSGEPIVIDDAAAARQLGPLVDGLLSHDRPIRARYDDSVCRVVAGRPRTVRRARGLAPAPLPLPVAAPQPVLAVGAHLKNTVAVAVGGTATIGPHIGDLSDATASDAFAATVERLCRWQGVDPAVVAHDLHPGYRSTRFAVARGGRRIAVQHHHAHIAAVAAEHGLTPPFLGVAYDGLGLGDDGTLWGGEILLATYTGYRRLGRFGRAPLPGGEAAVRRPARMALGYLFGGEDLGVLRPPADSFTARLDPRVVATVRLMVDRGINVPPASSAGRLFDAVASLLGLCDDATYEAEAAVLLEAAATPDPRPGLPWRLVHRDGLDVYDPTPTLAAVLAAAGTAPGDTAAAFHTTIAEVTEALVANAARRTGVRTVCLGGGVFTNRRLTTDLLDRLAGAGFTVHTGVAVPVGDGGISYGQAAVAAARLARE